MSFDQLAASSETDVATAILAHLRADIGVQSRLGTPPRIFDDETENAIFPYAELTRVETEPADSSGVRAQVHRLTISTLSRHGGRQEALALVGAVRRAVEARNMQIPGKHVVLCQVFYSDVVRTADKRRFRGLVSIKLVTEEAG